MMVYGKEPPQVIPFETGSTKNWDLEVQLQERDLMLSRVRENLFRAQDLMKKAADKRHRDVVFLVGDMVYLKLQP